ncbi:MAG: dihydrofolate reductase [Myxococcales bacterium]|nr:dihydrofolate reductase [Myxococcales bacterium]
MSLSLIAALAENRVIGVENRLPWRLPADLARFKRLTMGHCLLMGRKTYESIGRPLPGRTTIVLTRDPAWSVPEGVQVARTVDEALALAGEREVFVAGGAEIYRQTLGRADRLYLTILDRSFDGDVRFPEIDLSAWHLTERERHEADATFASAWEFTTWARLPCKVENAR